MMRFTPSRRAVYRWATLVSAAGLFASFTQAAQKQQAKNAADALHQLNDSVQALVRRVSPSVVQILVTGYRSTEQAERGETNLVIGRERAIGSGVIVDSEGYIVTNAHVLNGAERIEVVVPPQVTTDMPADGAQENRVRSYEAHKIGIATEIDLAVIKIDAHGLPALPIRGTTVAKQGELVFAFGSPEGLRNTVTMGVVSAVARQPDPDSPLVYIQTDAPINPGNSGGPLVNTDGELLGINTFILSTSGGNQGLGFALPAGVLAFAYPQLVKYGHIHQPEIGVLVQAITPELAAGLQLQRDVGIIVSDVMPGGPADTAGLKIQDIIVGVDGKPTGSVPLFTHSLYMHQSGERARITVLRGSQQLQIDVSVAERPHKEDSLIDTADPEKNLVRRLGIIGIELNLQLAQSLPDLRLPTGVIVAALTAGARSQEIPLQTGDVIHGLNGAPVTTLAGLREALAKLQPGDAVALQIERYGQMIYVSFML
jgi:serine protease Do